MLRQATSLIRPYDDGARRPHLPPWWRIWLDALLERWAARLRQLRTAHNLEDGEVAGLMQLGAGPWRSELWRGLLLQLRDYPSGIQGVVARRIRQWLKQQLDDMAPGFMALGAMLADLEKEDNLRVSPSEEERTQGVRIGDSVVEMLSQALNAGSLVRVSDRDRVGPAVRDAARDIAIRADRRDRDEQVPINDTWDNALEDEELRVGATLTKWVRQRLPTNPQARRQLFLQVVNGLRLQVSQECRHLRRLHMGLEQMYCMGEGAAYSVGTLETMDDLPQDARDLVDQIIMNIGNDARGQTVLDMLQGQASSSASSSSTLATGSLLQECDALRRWLNGAFEGSLSTLMEEQQDLEELGVLPTGDSVGNQSSLADRVGLDCLEENMTEELQGPMNVERGGPEQDDASLVQRPPWEQTGKRGRTRSRSRERRTWRSANASGWTDGNEHRPCRRTTASGDVCAGESRPSASASRPSTSRPSTAAMHEGRNARRDDHSQLLRTVMGPQAWQCLLDMRSPMEPVADWGYGLPPYCTSQCGELLHGHVGPRKTGNAPGVAQSPGGNPHRHCTGHAECPFDGRGPERGSSRECRRRRRT